MAVTFNFRATRWYVEKQKKYYQSVQRYAAYLGLFITRFTWLAPAMAVASCSCTFYSRLNEFRSVTGYNFTLKKNIYDLFKRILLTEVYKQIFSDCLHICKMTKWFEFLYAFIIIIIVIIVALYAVDLIQWVSEKRVRRCSNIWENLNVYYKMKIAFIIK
jgi:hypothetical protein